MDGTQGAGGGADELTQIWAELADLRAENVQLRADLGRSRAAGDGVTDVAAPDAPFEGRVARRHMLRFAGAAAGGLVLGGVAAVTRAAPASADSGDDLVIGTGNFAGTDYTSLSNWTTGLGFNVLSYQSGESPPVGFPSQASALYAYTDKTVGAAVHAQSKHGPGIFGDNVWAANGSPAVHGRSAGEGNAVFGEVLNAAANANGVLGRTAGTGNAVLGIADGPGNSVFGAKSQAGDAVVGYTSSTGRALLGVVDNAASAATAVHGTTNGTGDGVFGELTKAGNTASGVHGRAAGKGNAVFGEVLNTSGTANAVLGRTVGSGNAVLGISDGVGNSVYGFKTTSGDAVVGLTSGNGRAVLGVIQNAANNDVAVTGTTNGLGGAVFGDLTAAGNSASAVFGRTVGTGNAVLGIAEGAGNSIYGSKSVAGDAVVGRTTSTGRGLYGLIENKLSNAPAVDAETTGKGPALRATSKKGRGGLFTSDVAQIQLKPSTAGNHPTAGQRGDLFVDSTGRLWFCQATGNPGTWTQVA